MMRLSTLLSVDRLIDDRGLNPIATQVAAPWDPTPESVRFVRSSANFVYQALVGERPAFLRFASGHERDRAELEREVAIVHALAAAGVAVPSPLRSSTGSYVESIRTDLGLFHAAVFTALEGRVYEAEELSADACGQWGRSLARLHGELRALRSDLHVGVPGWRERLDACRRAVERHPLLSREFDHLKTELAAIPAEPATFGLIHGDFQPDNLVWGPDRIGVLDFGDVARHWYAADIAIGLADLDAVPPADLPGGILHNPRTHAFIAGYRSVREIRQEEIDRIPTFLRLHRLLLHCGLIRTLDQQAGPGVPAWMESLIERLSARLAEYQDSLARGPGERAQR